MLFVINQSLSVFALTTHRSPCAGARGRRGRGIRPSAWPGTRLSPRHSGSLALAPAWTGSSLDNMSHCNLENKCILLLSAPRIARARITARIP